MRLASPVRREDSLPSAQGPCQCPSEAEIRSERVACQWSRSRRSFVSKSKLLYKNRPRGARQREPRWGRGRGGSEGEERESGRGRESAGEREGAKGREAKSARKDWSKKTKCWESSTSAHTPTPTEQTDTCMYETSGGHTRPLCSCRPCRWPLQRITEPPCGESPPACPAQTQTQTQIHTRASSVTADLTCSTLHPLKGDCSRPRVATPDPRPSTQRALCPSRQPASPWWV